MDATAVHRLEQLAVVRAAWGALLLVAPWRVLASVPGAQPARAASATARVLGARHLLQATAALAHSRSALRTWWVDALHSASMIALATASPANRPLAGADAVIAAAFALATHAADSS